MLPHGSAHVLRGANAPAGARGPFGIRSQALGSIQLKSNIHGEPEVHEPEVQLICGRLRFESAHRNLVAAALRDAIMVSAADDALSTSRLQLLMSAIQEELEGVGPGATAIAADLASALFVMVVRIYLQREGPDSGRLALLAHRQLGRVVAAMVNDPGAELDVGRARGMREYFARQPCAHVPRHRTGITCRVPGGVEARTCPAQAMRHLPSRRRHSGRGRLQVGKCLQSCLPSPFRPATR